MYYMKYYSSIPFYLVGLLLQRVLGIFFYNVMVNFI